MLGYISIFLGMATIIILLMRRWNPIIVGLVAATIVIVLNGLSFEKTMTKFYFEGFATMFKTLFPVIFSGNLLAQIYNRTGAMSSIGDKVTNLVFKEGSSATQKYIFCILSMVLSSGLISYFGMNSLVTLIAMYPLCLRMMEKAGIPKRFVMGILSAGVYTFAMTAPGSAEVVNVLAMEAVGTTSTVGIVGGLVASITEIAVMTIVMTLMIKKAVRAGERFSYGPKDIVFDDNREKPSFILSLLPLLVLFVLFNLAKMNIFLVTLIAWILSMLFFIKYLPMGQKREIILETIDNAVKATFGPVGSVGSIVGFTTILQSIPEFQNMLNAIFNLRLPAVFIVLFAIFIVAAMTSSSSAAIRVGIPMILDKCRQAGLTDAFIHRVSCFASSVVDTLPYGTAIIINLQIADLDMKEGYPPMFVSTTLATFCGTVICALTMGLFPSLP